MFKCIAKPQANYTELLARKQDEPGQKGGGHSSQNGYYQVHIYLEQTRGLVNPAEADSAVNPIIRGEAFGQKRHSSTKKNQGTGMTYWGEHMFFIKKFDDESEFETEKMKISIFDDKLIGSDALIGCFEADFSSIHQSESHSWLHRWLALSNFEKGFDEIKGYILISVNVVKPGDEMADLKDLDPTKGEEAKMLLPPHLVTKPWQMKISLVKAENLVKLDLIGSIDCYLKMSYGGAEIKTDTKKDNLHPVWKINCFLPYSEPAVDDWLSIQIFDYDMLGKDEAVGSSSVSKKEILEGKKQDFFWLNIYGAQTDGIEQTSKPMNEHPQLGSFWKGRILLSIVAQESEKPKKAIEPMDEKIVEELNNKKKIYWSMIAEIFYGENFPDKKEKYSVEIRWADEEMLFPALFPTRGIWEWYERKRGDYTFPYDKLSNLPDIFVYIRSDSKRFSFLRLKASDCFRNFSQSPVIRQFTISKDKYSNYKDEQAGYLKLRIVVGLPIDLEKIDRSYGWNTVMRKPELQETRIIFHLYNGKNLIPADDNGMSDPFLVFSYFGRTQKTEVIQKTLNPIWNSSYEMQIPFSSMENSPPLFLNLWDEDLMGEEFIGSARLNLEEAKEKGVLFIDQSTIPKPQWFDMKFCDGGPAGQILLSISLFTSPSSIRSLPSLLPPNEKYNVKIRVLGVRGLQMVGLDPIRKPVVVFNVNSLRGKNDKIDLPEKSVLRAEAKGVGPDANFSTVLSFTLELPKDPLVWPNLNCVVKNQVWMGAIEVLLGTFTIDLCQSEARTRKTIEKKLLKANPTFKAPIPGLIQNSLSLDNVIQSTKTFQNIQSKNGMGTNNGNNDNNFGNNSKANAVGQGGEGIKKTIFSPFGSNIPSFIGVEGKEEPQKMMDKKMDIVIMAKYSKIPSKSAPVELDVPDLKQYMRLGFDAAKDRLDPTKTTRHYRYLIDKNLEDDNRFIDARPFDEYIITRGQRTQSNSFFNKLMGFDDSLRALGIFKCWIEIMTEANKHFLEKYNAKPINELFNSQASHHSGFSSLNSSQRSVASRPPVNIDKEFMQDNLVIVRLHIIDVFSLVQLDSEEPPNPYIKVRLGNQVFDNESEFQKGCVNASFYKTFELQTSLPGSCLLNIQIMDHHNIVEDTIIGETTIDLENRFFSKKWRKLNEVPIETRKIYNPICSIPSGQVRLFLEVIPLTDKFALKRKWFIQPKAPEPYEIRCVVWEINGCPSVDVATDTSDFYVTGTIGDVIQKTDIHWQASGGLGSFNWRMVFPIILPAKDNTITFQVWDTDLLNSDDYISSVTMDFSKQAKDAFENDIAVKIMNKGGVSFAGIGKALEKGIGDLLKPEEQEPQDGKVKAKDRANENEQFEIDLEHVETENAHSIKKEGKIKISFEIIPGKLAESNPVGKGRGDPNVSPFCPPPEGRIQLSLNPFKMLTQMFGPKAKGKICIICCCVFCCVIFLALIPVIAGNLGSKMVSSIFGIDN